MENEVTEEETLNIIDIDNLENKCMPHGQWMRKGSLYGGLLP